MTREALLVDLAIRVLVMVAVFVLFWFLVPSYHSLRGISAILDGAVVVGLTALGIGVTMLAAEFDLSVGSLAAAIGILTVNLTNAGLGLASSILIGVLVAGGFGALQGFVIALTGINSLVLTIGSLIALRGVALLISGENSVTLPVERLDETDVLSQSILGVFTPFSIMMILAFVAVGLFLRFTVWGREIFAIGGGRSEARAAGVSVIRPLVIAFATSSALSTLR